MLQICKAAVTFLSALHNNTLATAPLPAYNASRLELSEDEHGDDSDLDEDRTMGQRDLGGMTVIHNPTAEVRDPRQ